MGRLDRFRGLRLRGGVREYVLEWTFRISLLLCSVGVVPTCRRSASFGLISFALIMSRDSRCAGGVLFYMVAWFYELYTHSVRPLRARSLLIFTLCACAQMSEAAAAKTASTLLPPFEKERPKASTVLDWTKSAKALLPADHRSLIDGTTPRCLLAYTPATVPPAVTASEASGISPAAVISRETSILNVEDTNALKKTQRAAHESELRLTLFLSIENALMLKAPLLLERLKRDCLQTIVGYENMPDGVKAWRAIEAMSSTAAQAPGEALDHDAQLLLLQYKPLPDTCTPDEFSTRVSTAIENHFPYLERKFDTPEGEGLWVLRQMPAVHGAEGAT